MANPPAWCGGALGPYLLFEHGLLVAATPAACHELGREESALMGAALLDDLLDADRARLVAALDEVAADPSSVGPAGRVEVVTTTGGPYHDVLELRLHGAGPGQVVALALDVSEEHRLDAVVGHLSTATVLVDERGAMIWRPPGNAARMGIPDREVLGTTTFEWLHPEDLPELLRLLGEVVAVPGSAVTGVFRGRQPYREDVWIRLRITGVNALHDPHVKGVVVRTEEVGDAEVISSVGHTSGQFQSLADAAPVGIIVTDRDGLVLYRNALAQELLGEVDGAWVHRARPSHHAELTALIEGALRDRTTASVLAPFDDERAGTRWLTITAVPQTDEGGQTYGLIATLQDVTTETEAREELRQAQDRLWSMANHDQLTGLANRSLLTDRLEQAIARHHRDGHGVAVLYCDLDGFKAVNDRHGHGAGDLVLVEVARRLGTTTRETDTVCRFGGDEFLVLVESFDDESEVHGVAQRIIDAVAAPLTSVPGARVGITVGISFAGDDQSAGGLLARADNAMYRAKARGKGRYEIYA